MKENALYLFLANLLGILEKDESEQTEEEKETLKEAEDALGDMMSKEEEKEEEKEGDEEDDDPLSFEGAEPLLDDLDELMTELLNPG